MRGASRRPYGQCTPSLLGKDGTIMYLRIVTFGLDGVTPEQYAEQATAVAGEFVGWPGLCAKYWLANEGAGRYGGVYVFADKESADMSRTTPLFGALAGNPAFTDLTITEYDTLSAPTAITAGALR